MEEVGQVELLDDRSPHPIASQGPSHLQIEQALASILLSSIFRTSKQSQRLLQYLVEQTLQGHDEMLKERIVGAQVFGKQSDYNTGDDPIVRVRASDLRKRLAQYYAADGMEDHVRIELHPGSYHPCFLFSSRHESVDRADEAMDILPPASASDGAPSHGQQSASASAMQQIGLTLEPEGLSRKHVIAIAAALCLVALTVAGLAHRMQGSAADTFWQPVLKSSEPALIYFGTDAVYSLSNEYLDSYLDSHHVDQQGREFFVDLPPGTKIDAKDLVHANDRVMVNDFAAAAEVVTFLNHHGKPFDVRWGHDISPGDLRHAPVILIGAFNNYLTLELTNQLRFEFIGGNQIKDRANPQLSWSRNEKGTSVDDYAIVSRLVRPESGVIVIAAAGIGPEGTQAAGEFLNSASQIANAVKGLPPDWNQKNMQILLHVKAGYGVSNVVSVESVFLK
ncbi:Adenylate cyclase [Acidisarcina polymorpha]|uniref:Adenylate cyclase n=1 Tax=Acidisarcina polymorpha TaxID=2211140 RepID=A0A2Z5FZV2_9BACT|nr:hypothetical protein [Acidisarcina polymorpha]AXC12260.1 Adenylate cyclase [Acidisarcina polymorpha]